MKKPQPQQVFALFNEIGILAQLSRSFVEAHLPEGILMSHFGVLSHLLRVGDGSTPLELAQAFQVPKTSMTHTLSGLERRSFIETRPHPTDGRSKQVWLLDAGKTFHSEAIAAVGPDIMQLAASFPEADYAQLIKQLAQIRKVLDTARK